MKKFLPLFLLFFCQAALPLLHSADEKFNAEELKWIEEIQRRGFDFFWNEFNSRTGLIADRAYNFDRSVAQKYNDALPKRSNEGGFRDSRENRASLASVGFGLTAFAMGIEHKWITKEQAQYRIKLTLDFIEKNLFRHGDGLWDHFLFMDSGKSNNWDNHSLIDSTLFLMGSIFIGEYWNAKFGDPAFKQQADRLYRRIQWNAAYPKTLGLDIPQSRYNEYIICTLMAMASPNYSLKVDFWNAMVRDYQVATANRPETNEFPRVFYPSLFVHQYPQVWFDFRNKHDRHLNYFDSAINATLANRQYCIDHAIGGIAEKQYQFATYSENCWGLTAGDAPPPKGYDHYGEGLPGFSEKDGMRGIDGTVLPHAAGGSFCFTPRAALDCLKYMKERWGNLIWGRYGFVDSFNTDPRIKNKFNRPDMWLSTDVLAIDVGTVILMMENDRTGLVWKYFMMNEYIKEAMKKAGFTDQEAMAGNVPEVTLAGKWKLKTNDSPSYSGANLQDEAWPLASVPRKWEDEGYAYDGIAWYRKKVTIPEDWENSPSKMVLQFGGIDDADECYFNGTLIGLLGSFPPKSQTAWTQSRVYEIPKNLIRFGKENIIALRVADYGGGGGIYKGPVRIIPYDSLNFRPFAVAITKLQLDWQPVKVALKNGFRSVRASSAISGNAPGYASDGDMASRWESEHKENQWIEFELAKKSTIKGIEICWEHAAAKDYSVSLSKDGKEWKELSRVTDGALGETRNIAFPSPEEAQFIRIDCRKRASEWGFSIYEVNLQ